MSPKFNRDLLTQRISGRRVLFVNGIRSDRRSGGDSVTQLLLSKIAPVCTLRQVDLSPSGFSKFGKYREFIFALIVFPAPIFSIALAITGNPSFEFVLRLSFYSFLRVAAARLFWRPDVVIVNHHSVFPLVAACGSTEVITIWHDVPSHKVVSTKLNARVSERPCARMFERWVCRRSSIVCAFSVHEKKTLEGEYLAKCVLLPSVALRAVERTPISPAPSVLFLGNWSRKENSEGINLFWNAMAERCALPGRALKLPQMHFAGFGAEIISRQLAGRLHDSVLVTIKVSESYVDLGGFDDWCLVAPLASGAGIKIKTIEALAAGIPVIGTAQAFTGLPSEVVALGGRVFPSFSSIVDLVADAAAFREVAFQLQPRLAFERYCDLFR